MPRTIHVAKNGSNANDGTEAKPVLTINKAIGLSASGDTILVGDGTYAAETHGGTTNTGLYPKSGITIRAKNRRKAVIDQQDSLQYGFFLGSRKNVVIEGFEIRNCTVSGINAGGNPSTGIVIRDNHVHHCKNNGIQANGADLLTIDGNEVNHCANSGAQSGISVWNAMLQEGDDPADGYRIKVINNNCHHQRPDGGSTSDGNGIIIDQLSQFEGKIYPKGKVLVAGNTCWRNRGSGIRLMASKGITVEYNTAWDNGQNVTPDVADGWCGEIHAQWTRENVIRYNIGMAGRAPSGGWGNTSNSNATYVDAGLTPADGNTIVGNIFTGFDGDGSGQYVAGKAQNCTPSSSQKADPGTNMIGVDPLFVDPANGDFSTKSNSPARGAAGSGKDIGAWQSGGKPPDPEPEPDDELEERVALLENEVADLQDEVAALQGRLTALESWAGAFKPT